MDSTLVGHGVHWVPAESTLIQKILLFIILFLLVVWFYFPHLLVRFESLFYPLFPWSASECVWSVCGVGGFCTAAC